MDAEKISKEVIVEKEVIKEVIVEKEVIKEVPVEVIVEKEVIKEVTAVDDRIYEGVHCNQFKGKFDEVADHEVECQLKAIQKLNAQLSARDAQMQEWQVEKTVEIHVDRPVQVLVEVIKEVVVEKIVEIEVEKIVEVLVEVPVQVLVEVIKEVEVVKIVEVERIDQLSVKVPVEIIKEVPIEVIKEVFVEKIIEVPRQIVEVVVEKVIEKIVKVPVQVFVEVPVKAERCSAQSFLHHAQIAAFLLSQLQLSWQLRTSCHYWAQNTTAALHNHRERHVNSPVRSHPQLDDALSPGARAGLYTLSPADRSLVESYCSPSTNRYMRSHVDII